MSSTKEYELILLGATGYTGKWTAEHIATSLPTDLKWAVAGRSAPKLQAIVDEIRALNPDRLPPAVEVVQLEKEDLNRLVKKTKLVLTTVGPYSIYGTPVVEACAENGVHYVDVTGESPWVLRMIQKYHETAKTTGALMIPQMGVESAPSDLLAWALVTIIRNKLHVGTKEIIASLHEMITTPSGGTLASVAGIFDNFTLKEFVAASKPWALSPIKGALPVKPWTTKLFGVLKVPELGVLTTSMTAAPNIAFVERTAGLIDGGKLYGKKFNYSEYMRVKNTLTGILVHYAVLTASVLFLLPPVRWLIKKVTYAPGEGPTREAAALEKMEFRAVATADQDVPTPAKAKATFRHAGGMYRLTGILLAEAGYVILRGDQEKIKKLGGGILTPAMLGQEYIDRLKAAGIIFEVEME